MNNEMNRYMETYRHWLLNSKGRDDIHDELLDMINDPDKLIDSFYTELTFGTSGIRGVIGAGTNRMNYYTVGRATQGLSNYLVKNYGESKVIIAYDTRLKSDSFGEETARILMENGIDTLIFSNPTPVSLLSYAIRQLKATMGIIITASHNPKVFNGYKVYNSSGYQIVGSEAKAILNEIQQLDYFDQFKESKKPLEYVDKHISEGFIDHICSLSPLMAESDVFGVARGVYTPLNGTGNFYVRKVMDKLGYGDIVSVPEQELPDSNFTTCPVPNPEKITAYSEAFKVLDRENGDFIIATDPDSDRVGVALLHDDMKVLLTGNQLGILILEFLCKMKPPTEDQMVIKSIVTTPLIDKICEKHGLKVVNTLTGFKYIGEIISNLEKNGDEDRYYFGFEESNGYLIDTFIRDKDGVSAAMIAFEMAAYYKSKGMDLLEKLRAIYEEYGYCIDKTRNYYFEGSKGRETMKRIMALFRSEIRDRIGQWEITEKTDYMSETTGLPPADVLSYRLSNGSQFLIRPSGTEAKLKVYLFEAEKSSALDITVKKIIDKFSDM